MDKVTQTVTTVTEDYLKALWSAEMRGSGMSVNQLAAKMGVVASTASENVARLKAMGLVDHQPYKKVHLSDEGRAVAVGMIRRHRIIETYLHQALGFDWDELHVEAEILEHAISDRLLDRLDQALGHPTRDPHGDPIPAPDGTCFTPQVRPLTRLRAGDTGVIGRISDRYSYVLRDLCEVGIGLDTPLLAGHRHTDGRLDVHILTPEGEADRVVTLGAEHVESLYVVDEAANATS